jgi:hypothetical protein
MPRQQAVGARPTTDRLAPQLIDQPVVGQHLACPHPSRPTTACARGPPRPTVPTAVSISTWPSRRTRMTNATPSRTHAVASWSPTDAPPGALIHPPTAATLRTATVARLLRPRVQPGRGRRWTQYCTRDQHEPGHAAATGRRCNRGAAVCPRYRPNRPRQDLTRRKVIRGTPRGQPITRWCGRTNGSPRTARNVRGTLSSPCSPDEHSCRTPT